MPLHNLKLIMVFGYSGASPALMGKCVQEGIELVFMKPNGSFLARVDVYGCKDAIDVTEPLMF